jgi:hypothetical protein
VHHECTIWSAGLTPAVTPQGEGTHVYIEALSSRGKFLHFGTTIDLHSDASVAHCNRSVHIDIANPA